jgi:hypothetical protein
MEIIKKKRAPRKKPELSIVTGDEAEMPVSSLPEFVAIGLVRYKDNTYSQVTVKVTGDKAEILDVDEPNMRAIAIDSLKIAVMKRVIDAQSF